MDCLTRWKCLILRSVCSSRKVKPVMSLFSFTVTTNRDIRPLYCILLVLFSLSGFVLEVEAALKHDDFDVRQYFSQPFSSEDSSQRILLLKIDQSKGMLERAYSSKYFDPMSKDGSIGYFNPHSQYHYSDTGQYFEEDESLKKGQKDAWDGQFLNWLLMRQIDMARYHLMGVQTKNSSENKLTDTLIELESANHTLKLYDAKSLLYSPIPNYIPIKIENAELSYQDKTIQLRLKNPHSKKGLLDLITDQVVLYFYADKTPNIKGLEQPAFIFGDATTLSSYLDEWSANESSYNPFTSFIQSEEQALKSFQQALAELKWLTLNNNASGDEVLCQRYAHIAISSSPDKYSFLNEPSLEVDCQKEIKGTQAFNHYSLLTSDDSPAQAQTKAQAVFNYHNFDALISSVFKAFYIETRQYGARLSGADMSYFPDNTGVIYQSTYHYSLKDDNNELHWLGDLKATLTDEQGRLRSDNGDGKLGDLKEDPIISSCFDEQANILRVRFLTASSVQNTCSMLNYPYLEEDIGYLWQASSVLNKLNDENINSQRAPFKSHDSRRFIRSHIGNTEYDFVAGEENSNAFQVKPEWLNLGSQKESEKLIKYIRGLDQQGLRSRQTNKKAYLLGDTVNQTPLAVGKPSSNYHLLYGDQSYLSFLEQYHNRRSRVFMSTNNGVLHSFNAGMFDGKTKTLKKAPEHAAKWSLGQEIWAFVPFTALPYLSEVSDPAYGLSPQHHLSLIKPTLYVFDAKVFGANGLSGQPDRVFINQHGQPESLKTHPEGWGTLLVVGVGLGSSAYLVFDITDAEQAPSLLAELKVKNLGSAISLPSAMTQKNQEGELEWKLVIGSGTDLDPVSISESSASRSAGVYIFDLKTIQSETAQSKATLIDLNAQQSYVTGISTVDWNLDAETDALYVNTASIKNDTGELYRIHVQNKNPQQTVLTAEQLLDAQAPLIDRPTLSLDALNNRWIYASTGRRFQSDNPFTSNFEKNKIIGLKEPRNAQGAFLVDSVQQQSGKLDADAFVDVSNIIVDATTGNLSGSWFIQPNLQEKTVAELEEHLMQFENSTSYLDGWVRYLDTHETATGESKLFGGMLTQASYREEYQYCLLSNHAFIHRLRFTTGTSWYLPNKYITDTPNSGAELKTTKTPSIGTDGIQSILLHEEDGHIHQLQTSEDGTTHTISDLIFDAIQSAEVSWREL